MDFRWRASLVYLVLGAFQFSAGQTSTSPVAWDTSAALPGVDFSGLGAAQKQKALEMLRSQGCPCGCGMKIAECRFKDPGCSYSNGLSAVIIQALKEGKSAEEIAKLEAASRWSHPPSPPKLLEDPVQISLKGNPSLGPADARITLVEFSDFECPYCSQAAGEVRTVLEGYPKDIRLVYKQFPLEMHPHAKLAALASIAALNQNKFWPMHDKLFANSRKLTRENILAWAKDLGMDMATFAADLGSPKSAAAVDADMKHGLDAGVNGTPAFFINGKHYNGPFTMEALKPVFDAELKAR